MAFCDRHLLGIEKLDPGAILEILNCADDYVDLNRQTKKNSTILSGLTQINMFFENSTRTQASFELAGKRLGADVMNMAMQASSIKKGETLIDTALTLNAMNPDLIVVRHPQSGAVKLLAEKVNCSVINAGDGLHEHPTQALLDALTIRRAKGRIQRLSIAICGDIAHSRVARSNLMLLSKLGNRVRLIGPRTLMPSGISEFGVVEGVCDFFFFSSVDCSKASSTLMGKSALRVRRRCAHARCAVRAAPNVRKVGGKHHPTAGALQCGTVQRRARRFAHASFALGALDGLPLGLLRVTRRRAQRL